MDLLCPSVHFWRAHSGEKRKGRTMPTPPKDLRDILTMRNGDSLNAKVLNKTFTIDTDFGKLTAKTSDIVHITMEKGLPHQMIVTAVEQADNARHQTQRHPVEAKFMDRGTHDRADEDHVREE